MILINQRRQNKNIKKVLPKKTKSEPELKSKFGESVAERSKLRKQRLDEIAKKEKMINNNLFKEYFEYSSPSDMYKNLNTTTNIEKSKTKLNKTKNDLANLMVDIENNPTNNANKTKNRNNMVEIVELILNINQLNQEGRLENFNNEPNAQ